jgi:hypothetical protein
MTGDGCITQTVSDAAADLSPEGIDPGFVASAEHTGARPGFVFKNGPQGLGYYTDKHGRLLKALDKLEAKIDPTSAAARAISNKAAAPSSDVPVADEIPQGKRFEVTFTEPK